jgi:serine/threonine protein kinase
VAIVANSDQADEQITALETEISLLKTLEHPNIVQYLGCQRSNRKLNIFLELIVGGTITQAIRKMKSGFDEARTRRYTYQLLNGLNYLHLNRILHLDVKGSNLLLEPTTDTLKLADFGCARVIRSGSFNGEDDMFAPDFKSGTGFNTTLGTPQVGLLPRFTVFSANLFSSLTQPIH